ncbi:LysR family transcriptional regulator [Bacillus sp. DTU_2020_1000418_1_SI_GHA_SEK_038]|uniref:LysR family transcriptional regulator n=1 Tax=Bacillus sp. DTU_2020_1000418_1_SI_GHA_SEK_038 TaxID=3077585 RepID=UPI0028EDD968|nr:LysR family transcriptional regulator [Bacillus sp. DTU_2020_1000418_1_SI_GHA_SEK_038]WNS75390.1 LysR family transcriptional regulator [Bacillus sp. DTU_2020_1000418_1_SI_GHA_SEK_038]
MDIRQLRYFVTVVQEKNYSKAASILHISQPSLSNAIRKLETAVGFQLLERNTRRLALTDSGRIFYKRSLQLIRNFDNMLKDLDAIKQHGTGKITIGMIESTKFWLPKAVNKFKKSFSNIQFQLIEILGKETVYKSLMQYDVHFTITNQPIDKKEIHLIPLYDENLILLTHKDDILNQKERITLHDLKGRDFIISKVGLRTREDILKAFEEEKIIPQIMYEIERFETAYSFVEQGLGVTILPESYIKYTPNPNITMHMIESEHLKRTVYLAYLKDRYLSPAVCDLLEEIKGFFK